MFFDGGTPVFGQCPALPNSINGIPITQLTDVNQTPSLTLNLVTDLGADPTGNANSYCAFKWASLIINARGGFCTIFIPAGQYQIAPIIPAGQNFPGHCLGIGSWGGTIACQQVKILGSPEGDTHIFYVGNLQYGLCNGVLRTPQSLFHIENSSDIEIRDIHADGPVIGMATICDHYGIWDPNAHTSGLNLRNINLSAAGLDIWYNCADVSVTNCTFNNFFQDGIHINGDPQNVNHNITLERVQCNYNGRMGLAVTGANGLQVSHSAFSFSATGPAKITPSCGIDFEPNGAFTAVPPVQNVTFSDCEAIGNLSSALQILPNGVGGGQQGNYSQNMTFIRCRFGDYDNYMVDNHNNNVEACAKNLTFDDCEFEGKVEAGFYAANLAEGILFKNCQFSDRENALGNYRSGFVFRSKYDTRFLQFENCAFTAIHGGQGIINCMTTGPVNGAADPNHYTRFTDCRFTHADYSSALLSDESSFMRGCRFAGHARFKNMHSSGRNIVFSGLILEGGNNCEAAFFEGSGFAIKNCQDYSPGNDVLPCPVNSTGCINYPGFEIGQTGKKVLAKISKGSLTIDMNANAPITIQDNDVLQVGASCGLDLSGELLQNNGGLLAYQHAEPTLNIGDLNYSGTNTSWLFVDKRLPLNAITATGATNFNGQCVLGENGNVSLPCQPNYSNLLIGRSFQVLYKVVPGNSCAGTCSIAIRGGSGNYSIALDNVSTGGNTFSLTAGDHQLSITDNTNSCTEVFDLNAALQWLSPAEFYLGCDPIAQVQVEAMADNTVSYAVNGGFANTSGIFSGLSAGIYTVSASSNGCVSSRIIRVFRPTAGMCCAQPLVSDEETILMSGNAADAAALYGLSNPVQNKNILVDGTLQVSQSMTFQDCHFFFTPGSQMQLGNGVDLTLNACELKAACNEMWNGIIADHPTEQLLMQDCVVKDMEEGVQLLGNAHGTMVANRFVNNYESIQIFGNAQVSNCSITQNRFEKQGPLILPHAGEYPLHGIYVDNCTNLDIGDYGVASSGNEFDHLLNGITVNIHPYIVGQQPNQQIAFCGAAKIQLFNNRFSHIRPAGILPTADEVGVGVFANREDPFFSLQLNIANTLPVASNTSWSMFDCDYAVWLRRATAYVEKQRISGCGLGIVTTECEGRKVRVVENLIRDTYFGVVKIGDENAGGFTAGDNDIELKEASALGAIGIYSAYSNTSHPGKSSLYGNRITIPFGQSGIGLSLYKGSKDILYNNKVHFATTAVAPSAGIPKMIGIFSNACDAISLGVNTIDNNHSQDNTRTNYVQTNNAGIYLLESKNSVLKCNTSNYTRLGVFAVGANGSSSTYDHTAGNFFNNADANLLFWYLTQEGTLGQIGMNNQLSGTSYDCDNQYLEPHDMNPNMANAVYNKVFRVTACNSPFADQIVTSPSRLTQSNSTALAGGISCRTKVDPTAGNTQIFDCEVGQPVITGQPIDLQYAISVANGEIVYTDYWAGAKRANDELVMQWLENNLAAVGNSALLDSFYLAMNAGIVGQINAVDRQISLLNDSTLRDNPSAWMDNYNTALAMNNALGNTAVFEENAKMINAHYLSTLLHGQDTLSTEQWEEIEALALSCPYLAGNAVYRARVLWGLHNPLLHYDDLEICNNAGVYKGGANKLTKSLQALQQYQKVKPSSEAFKSTEILLYPNPTRSELNIKGSGCSEIHFYDLLGREVQSSMLEQDRESNHIALRQLPSGVYLYTIVRADQAKYYGKLTIQ